jgi:hypothetical protein
VEYVDAGPVLERLAGDDAGCVGAGKREFAGIGLGIGDQLLTFCAGMLGCITSINVKLPIRVTGVKSLIGSYGTFFIMNGTADSGELVAIRSV